MTQDFELNRPFMRPRANGPKKRIQPVMHAKVLRALHGDPLSMDDIVEFAGIGMTTLRQHLRAMRDEKLVWVADWRRDSRGHATIPLFKFDPTLTEDVPRPSRATWRQYRVRTQSAVARDVFAGLTDRL